MSELYWKKGLLNAPEYVEKCGDTCRGADLHIVSSARTHQERRLLDTWHPHACGCRERHLVVTHSIEERMHDYVLNSVKRKASRLLFESNMQQISNMGETKTCEEPSQAFVYGYGIQVALWACSVLCNQICRKVSSLVAHSSGGALRVGSLVHWRFIIARAPKGPGCFETMIVCRHDVVLESVLVSLSHNTCRLSLHDTVISHLDVTSARPSRLNACAPVVDFAFVWARCTVSGWSTAVEVGLCALKASLPLPGQVFGDTDSRGKLMERWAVKPRQISDLRKILCSRQRPPFWFFQDDVLIGCRISFLTTSSSEIEVCFFFLLSVSDLPWWEMRWQQQYLCVKLALSETTGIKCSYKRCMQNRTRRSCRICFTSKSIRAESTSSTIRSARNTRSRCLDLT